MVNVFIPGEDDGEPIRAGVLPKSIAVSKNFFGSNALKSMPLIRKWVSGLIAELVKRLCADEAKVLFSLLCKDLFSNLLYLSINVLRKASQYA